MRSRGADANLVMLYAENIISEAHEETERLSQELDSAKSELKETKEALTSRESDLQTVRDAYRQMLAKVNSLEADASETSEQQQEIIDALQQKVEEEKSKNERLSQELSECRAGLIEQREKQKAEIQALSDEVTELTNAHAALEAQIKSLKEKTFAPAKELNQLLAQSDTRYKALQKENAFLKAEIARLKEEQSPAPVKEEPPLDEIQESGYSINEEGLILLAEAIKSKINDCAFQIRTIQGDKRRVGESYDSRDYSSAMFNRGRVKLTKAAKRELKQLDEKEAQLYSQIEKLEEALRSLTPSGQSLLLTPLAYQIYEELKEQDAFSEKSEDEQPVKEAPIDITAASKMSSFWDDLTKQKPLSFTGFSSVSYEGFTINKKEGFYGTAYNH